MSEQACLAAPAALEIDRLATEIVALSHARAGIEVPRVPTSLTDRSLLTPAGMITAAGADLRTAIEASTNERCRPIFEFPNAHTWLQSLKQLPG